MKTITKLTLSAAVLAVVLAVQSFQPASTSSTKDTLACGGTNCLQLACGGTNAMPIACGGTNMPVLACGGTNSLLLACGGTNCLQVAFN